VPRSVLPRRAQGRCVSVLSLIGGEYPARQLGYTILAALRSRLRPDRVRLTTDGLASYLAVIEPVCAENVIQRPHPASSYSVTRDLYGHVLPVVDDAVTKESTNCFGILRARIAHAARLAIGTNPSLPTVTRGVTRGDCSGPWRTRSSDPLRVMPNRPVHSRSLKVATAALPGFTVQRPSGASGQWTLPTFDRASEARRGGPARPGATGRLSPYPRKPGATRVLPRIGATPRHAGPSARCRRRPQPRLARRRSGDG